MPLTEDDLNDGITHGLITESHHLELKSEIASGKAANRELARDLASLAIDGGTLIVGVAEPGAPGSPFSPAPVLLAGLRERIDSVCRSIPDPALAVVTREIPAASGGGTGYIVVNVPASPTAPHMVDGKYLGRGDATKYYLSDAEVRRLHDRRDASESDLLALLDEAMRRDPVPEELRYQAHLFLLALPDHPRPEMFIEHLHNQSLRQLLVDGAWNEETIRALGERERFSPTLAEATSYSRTSNGAAFSTSQLLPGRTFAAEHTFGAEDVVEVEISDEGAVKIFMGRLSSSVSRDGAPERPFLHDVAAVIYTRQLLGLVTQIAARTGYAGPWGLAVGATGVAGLTSSSNYQHGGVVDVDTYRRAAHATYAHLATYPGQLTNQLLGRLLRNLGTAGTFEQELSDPH